MCTLIWNGVCVCVCALVHSALLGKFTNCCGDACIMDMISCARVRSMHIDYVNVVAVVVV